ncbi:MAG: hypothetical protein IPK81_05725 [Rhodospirillales bacterium]|nr:MAG: hypothetical protein IPK81_05725 [Rhodospirillales bacterium]
MFLSTYTMKVDKKGRVSLPASWRAHLSADGFDGFIGFRSATHDAIDARGMRAFQALMAKLSAAAETKAGAFDAELFTDGANPAGYLASVAVDVGFDGEGRLSLPASLKDVVGAGCEQLVFVGRNNFFQIWSAEAWAAQQATERAAFDGRVRAARGGAA